MSYLYNIPSLPLSGDASLATQVPTGTGATARTMRARFGDVIWAADFGVTANGSTNDTTAWGNAFTAATGSGKYIVMAPAGVSIISSITIPTGVTLVGAAPTNSYLGGTVTTLLGSVLKKTSGTSAAITMSATSVASDNRGGGLANIALIGDGTHDGVLCAAAIPFIFDRCIFTSCNSAINGQYATIFVANCTFSYNSLGIWNVTDSRITHSGFNGNTNGIQLDSGANDNIISHCKIEFNSGNGIQVDTTEDNVISANIVDSNGASNIRWTNNRNGVINGNIMRNFADQVTMSGNHLYLSGNTETAVSGNSTKFDATTGTTPVNAVGGGANTSIIMIGNSWRGHSGSTAINASVTGLTTTGNLT
jgi:hypothetical protein